MKTPEEKKNEQADVLIKFVIVMMIIFFGGFLMMKCNAQTRPEIGYLVWIKDSQGVISQKFTSVNKAQNLVSSKTEGIYLNLVLKDSPFFEQRNKCRWIYCEKMKIVYKKNGKINFKRIKVK